MQRTFSYLRTSPTAQAWVVIVRWLLAVVFIVPGVQKLSGHFFLRATLDPGLMPFFSALYDAGPYWRFLGFCQVLAGVLLVIPRTSTLGALVCLSIYVNIVMILVSLPFYRADIVAGFLLLGANAGLIVWDLPKFVPLFESAPNSGSVRVLVSGLVRSRRFRLVAAILVIIWVVVHMLDRAGLL